MIVSYTWSQDAFRIGSFLQGASSKAPKHLLDLILKDLTDMHQIKDADGNIDYTFLPSLMVDNHAWNWYGNEFSMGQFRAYQSFRGPG